MWKWSELNDKRQITVVFCGNTAGEFLPIQLIYTGKTARCFPRYSFPPEWNITNSPNHWCHEDTMVKYVDNIILEYVEKVWEKVGAGKAALVIMDNFKSQATTKITKCLQENNILLASSKHNRHSSSTFHKSNLVSCQILEQLM